MDMKDCRESTVIVLRSLDTVDRASTTRVLGRTGHSERLSKDHGYSERKTGSRQPTMKGMKGQGRQPRRGQALKEQVSLVVGYMHIGLVGASFLVR